jgi:hypothetical protein
VKPAPATAPEIVLAAKATEKSEVAAAAFAHEKKAQPETPSPRKDRGSKLVEEMLRPRDAALPLFVTGPRRLPAAPFLEKPALPTTPYQGHPPRLTTKTAKPIRPHALPENTPLYGKRTSPRLPANIHLPAGELVYWPSSNSDEPPTLPTLAERQPDRAALGDPTAESSMAAALQAVIPLRTSLTPFVRLNLPDPFEHRAAARLRTPPPEDPTPAN